MVYFADVLAFGVGCFLGCFSGGCVLHDNLLIKIYMIQISTANTFNDINYRLQQQYICFSININSIILIKSRNLTIKILVEPTQQPWSLSLS